MNITMSSNPIGTELGIRKAVKLKLKLKLNNAHFDKIVGQSTIKTWKHLKGQAFKAADHGGAYRRKRSDR